MVKFNTSAGNPDIVYIFLDRIHTCQNMWTAELMKNLSDFVLSNILDKGFNVIQGLNEDAMLKEAAKEYTHAVVLSTGTEFINGDKFFHEVEKVVSSSYNFFLLGHIPDRDDGYYELHDQCYIINLIKYRELGSPTIGGFAYYSEHTQVEPIRSVDNVHDDYTPIWIKPGLKFKKYKHKWHGWNIISIALAAGELVEVFPEHFRNNKVYYYPNHEPAFIPKSTYLYGKNQVAAQTMFYPHNTEEVIETDFKGPIRQLVTQSSGLNWIDYLITYGYNTNTIVRFVDYNLFALECMKHIVDHWDGTNYAKFVKNYIAQRAAFLGKDGSEWLASQGKLYDPDIPEWTLIREIVKFEFRHQDLVLNKGLDVSTWVDNVPNTIIHLSHIFNYDPVAPFVPLKHRVYSERLLLDKLKKHIPDATIIIVNRLSDNIKCPTWRMNGDLDGI